MLHHMMTRSTTRRSFPETQFAQSTTLRKLSDSQREIVGHDPAEGVEGLEVCERLPRQRSPQPSLGYFTGWRAADTRTSSTSCSSHLAVPGKVNLFRCVHSFSRLDAE